MKHLTPEEIRCLDKTTGHQVNDTIYMKAYGTIIENLISNGYLVIGNAQQSLPYSDMAIIRKLLKERGEKVGGKKIDLVQRILQVYSLEELENAEIPKRYALTAAGEQIVQKNGALLYYFNAFGATNILTPERIIAEQEKHPNDGALDIIIRLLEEKVATESDTGKKRAYLAQLERVYEVNHDALSAQNAKLEIERLDKLWEIEREADAKKTIPFWEYLTRSGRSFKKRQPNTQDKIY